MIDTKATSPIENNSRLRLRSAVPGDVEGMLAIKGALRLEATRSSESTEGFLLGSTAEGYAEAIEHAHVGVLEETGEERVVGFAIAVPDELLRKSELWQHREKIRWDGLDITAIENDRVIYFDQLAVLPQARFRIYAPALAMFTVTPPLKSGHRHIFATAVAEPFRNLASIPLLESIGCRRVGTIEEEYPGVGRIVSDVYYRENLPADSDPISASDLGQRISRMMKGLMRG